MRPFVSLLREALEVAQQRKGTAGLSLSESFRSAAQEHARLAKGLEGMEDPVAEALARGRQALWALAQGNQDEACRLLRQAVRLHPALGNGLALKLAAQLCEEERALLEEKIQQLETAWAEAPHALRLLRALAELPVEVWKDSFRPRGVGPSRENRQTRENQVSEEKRATPRERVPRSEQRPRRPSRPEPIRFPLHYRGRRRSEEEGTSRGVEALYLLTTRNRLDFLRDRGGIHWWGDGWGLISLESSEDFSTLRLSQVLVYGARGRLLVLKGSLGSALLPLLPGMPTRLRLPPLAEPEEDIRAELWSWESLTPKGFRSLYQKATYRPRSALAFWLEAWLRFWREQEQALPAEEEEEWVRILEELLR